jgi:hypothetical protein
MIEWAISLRRNLRMDWQFSRVEEFLKFFKISLARPDKVGLI